MNNRRRKRKKDFIKLDSLSQINLNAAGIDIASEEHWVAIPEDRCENPVKKFGTTTKELFRLAAWLSEHGITHVAMESTGMYWMPLYTILESLGFEVTLVNPTTIKQIGGKKTDAIDCQWIQQLHTYGLLKGSYQPGEEIRPLRTYLRHRDELIHQSSVAVLHMQKALDQMNVLVHRAVSDITGKTGELIIRGILAGQRDPKELAKNRDSRCKKSLEDIAEALNGNFEEHHLFTLKQAYSQYCFLQSQIVECDLALQKALEALMPKVSEKEIAKIKTANPKKLRRKPKNTLSFDVIGLMIAACGVDLTKIDGVGVLTALTIICEIGGDVSAWPSAKAFSSWLGLCCGNRKSGGKSSSGQTRMVANRVAQALKMAASSLKQSQSPLGQYYRRMKAKMGPAQAITATAHKMARIIYKMLSTGDAYDPDRHAIPEAVKRERARKQLERKANKLDYVILTKEEAEALLENSKSIRPESALAQISDKLHSIKRAG